MIRALTEALGEAQAARALEIMRDPTGAMVDAYNSAVGPEARFDVDAWAAAVAAAVPVTDNLSATPAAKAAA